MTIRTATLTSGDVILDTLLPVTRETLVRYAGASGDFNPIHYRDDIAVAAGLPGVIAHGMLTMGLAIGALVDVLGDPARVVEYGCRFARPVIVDPVQGAELHVVATIKDVAEDGTSARVALTVSSGGTQVLVKAIATVSDTTTEAVGQA